MTDTASPRPSVPGAPRREDTRHDDFEYNPRLEPTKAKAWLNLLDESEDAFERYNDHCDLIDRQYANLDRLANLVRDKEYSMFWSNCEVLKPSIYASAPVPVVTPRFMDRRPVYQAASETLERCASTAFELAGIDELMKLVRDDLALADRGVAWCRYQSGDRKHREQVCIDFVNRHDFLHSLSRNWREVTWVAVASYMTRAEARERFQPYSGDEYQRAEYKADNQVKEFGGADNRERAKFWEIWSKDDKRVVWVAHGCELILDEDDPHLDLRGFFPCPKPAYGTVQRGSLVPVPDVLQYKDQLEEINLLTGRIHALSDALEAKGFYPAGGGEIAEAIQTAVAIKTPGTVLVPISNWAAFGGSKEVIIWMPIDVIAQVIAGIVTLRKQIIADIYQIMGLSDIMRGATDPQETLGAQQLKTQYGSVRIRDKQNELVRLARDLVEITTEIITEKFADVTIVEMSQTKLPSNAMVQRQAQQLTQQIQQAVRQLQQQPRPPVPPPPPPGAPGATSTGAADPQQQTMQQISALQDTLDKLTRQPTIEQVLHLLHDQRTRIFVLDIETDSTIVPDEQAEKQGRTEFLSMLAQVLPQLAQMITMEPKTAEFCGEVLKFAVAPFRAGRDLDGAVDALVEQMKMKAAAPTGPDPTTSQNQTALQIEAMKIASHQQTEAAKLQQQVQEMQLKDRHHQAEMSTQLNIAQMKIAAEQQADSAEAQMQNQRAMQDQQSHQADMIKKATDMQAAQQKAALAVQAAQQKAQDMAARQQERRSMQQFKMTQPQFPRRGGGLP